MFHLILVETRLLIGSYSLETNCTSICIRSIYREKKTQRWTYVLFHRLNNERERIWELFLKGDNFLTSLYGINVEGIWHAHLNWMVLYLYTLYAQRNLQQFMNTFLKKTATNFFNYYYFIKFHSNKNNTKCLSVKIKGPKTL